jgi:hypothetical protein
MDTERSKLMLSSLRALSWRVTAVLGLAFLAIALQLAVTGDRIDAERAFARAAGQPEPVAMSAFDPLRDIHAAGEVNLIVRIDPAAVITVSQQGQGDDGVEATMTRRVYPLQDPSDDKGSAVVRGAVLLSDQEVGDFLALVARTGEAVPGGARIVALNGLRDVAPPLAAPALAALRQLGHDPAPSFVFVMPFLDGRDVAMADQSGSWDVMVGLVTGLGGGLVALAIGKCIRRQRPGHVARQARLPGARQVS